MKMEPVAGWSLGKSGNSLLKTGAANRANACMSPPRSPIFMMPSHKERMPVNPMEISNPDLAEANDALMMSVNTAVSPPKMSLHSATAKAIRKKAIQM